MHAIDLIIILSVVYAFGGFWWRRTALEDAQLPSIKDINDALADAEEQGAP